MEFAGLSQIDGVRLISLQKGGALAQLDALPTGMTVETLGDDFDEGSQAFLDTAAAMKSCDLVITSDTAVAHLAGALGIKTWVALQYVPEWRWLLDRQDSPWYPTARLFRQRSRGDWKSVFQQMETELRSMG
jgi:ABC-type amino acid transport substrate-binding protein